MRKFFIAAGIVIALIVLAAVIFASTFDVNRYRGTIQAQLSKHLARNVTVGEMNLHFLPPTFVVHDVTISDDPNFNTQRPFVQTQELAVSVKLLPLLQKKVEIDSLSLQRPHVELVKNAQGRWNFASLGKMPSDSAPQPAGNSEPQRSGPAQPEKTSSQEQFSLSELVIRDGRIATTDEQARQPRAVYDHIDVSLRDFAPGRPFSVQAAAHLPGPNDQQVQLSGTGGPIQDQPAATPFHGTLNLQRVAISNARAFINSPALAQIDGIVSGQTKISSDSGKLLAIGDLTVQSAKMNGRDIGFPIMANYDVSDDVPADLLTVHNATIRLGNTPLQINGTVNSKSTPAQIDVRLKADGVSMADVARLAAASGNALPPGAVVAGILNANVEARGSATAPALNGTVSASDIQVSGKDFPQPVQVKQANLTLTPSEIRSDQFSVNSGGTAASVQFTVQQYSSKTPIINASVQAPNAELPAVLAMAKAYGVTSLDKVSGSGTLNVDLHAAGPVQSLKSNDVARDLNGSIGLNFHDVKYGGADMSHELSMIAGLVGLHQTNQGATTINQMKGNIAVKNGIAQTNDLEALLDIGNVGITGTFEHPRFAPDVQQIAQMKLKGLVPNFNNPAAAVSGLVGSLAGKPAANPDQSQQQPASKAIQELQNLLGKKRQK